MAIITTRASKGTVLLTTTELDANFNNLNTESVSKINAQNPVFTGTATIAKVAALSVTTNNRPTVKPSLNLDFANAAVLDSRVTFTRASTASKVNARGLLETVGQNIPRFDYDPVTLACKGLLIEEQRINLLEYSSATSLNSPGGFFSVDVSSIKAPDGTLTAVAYTSTAVTSQGLFLRAAPTTITAGVTYTVSCYVWVPTQSGISNWAINWDLADTETGTSATQTIFDSWVRVTAVLTPAAARSFLDFNLRFNGLAPTTAGKLLHVWGIQLEAGAFATSFIPSIIIFTGRVSTATYIDSTGTIQTAGTGVARYQYNLTDLSAAPVLLLESAATNLLLQSAFATPAWSLTDTILTDATITAPNGLVEADKLTEDAVSSEHFILQIKTGLTANGVYTASVYVKAAERNAVLLRVIDNTNYSNALVLDMSSISTGTIANAYAVGTATYIKSVVTVMPNSWFRISITGKASPTTTAIMVILNIMETPGTLSYLGVVNSGIYIWGAQLENAYGTSSYIQTTSAAVTRAADTSTSGATTRAADSAGIIGTNFSSWYNPVESTLFAAASVISTSYNQGVLVDIGAAGVFGTTEYINWTGTSWALNPNTAPINVASAVTTTSTAKIAAAIKLNDSVISANSLIGVVDTDCSVPIAPTVLSIGKAGWAGTTGFLNGHISRISYYPVRLSNTTLQALTT